MSILAHVTQVEFPMGLVVFLLGFLTGLAVAFAIRGRSADGRR